MNKPNSPVITEISEDVLETIVGGTTQKSNVETLKCPHCAADLGIYATPGCGDFGICPSCNKSYAINL